MTRRSKVWWVAAVLFFLINLGGAVAAAMGGEWLHAAAHAVLLLPGAYLVWRLAPRRYADRIWPRVEAVEADASGELTDRLSNLEQSLDAVAVEVERVGEGQRFMTRFFAEKGIPRAGGEGAAKPTESKAPKAAPDVRRD
jgi:hypothetical protein